MRAAAKPITREDMADTKPHAGVMATRPTTSPVAQPTAEGSPLKRPLPPAHTLSATPHPSMPVAADSAVFTHARDARKPDVSPLPELKPSQPKSKSPAPSRIKGTLCGLRALSTSQGASAASWSAADSEGAAAPPTLRGAAAAVARRVAHDTHAASTKADTPELVSTTKPPAKSSTPFR